MLFFASTNHSIAPTDLNFLYSLYSPQKPDISMPQIIYIFDPMCGWCYGFSPVIKKLEAEYRDRYEFRIMSGGMATGERAAPIGEAYSYIKGALPTVTERTGVPFGDAFQQDILEPGTYLYQSEPPCIALSVFRAQRPQEAIAFAHALQHAFFYEGKSLNHDATYRELAQSFELDGDQFVQQMKEPTWRDRTYAEWQQVAQMGVQGFPTVVLVDGQQGYLLSHGYVDLNSLKERLAQFKTTVHE